MALDIEGTDFLNVKSHGRNTDSHLILLFKVWVFDEIWMGFV